MHEIYDRLAALGYPRTYTRSLMPDWWTEETDADPACTIEGAMYLASALGISVRSVLGR